MTGYMYSLIILLIGSLCGNSDRVVVGGAEVVQLWEKNDNNVHVMNTSVDIPAGVTGMVFDTELNIVRINYTVIKLL